VELFYKAHLTPWLSLQPDLQVVLNPGGKYDDAVTAGLRFEADF
jgi:carbohydrate-selective porin OprB